MDAIADRLLVDLGGDAGLDGAGDLLALFRALTQADDTAVGMKVLMVARVEAA